MSNEAHYRLFQICALSKTGQLDFLCGYLLSKWHVYLQRNKHKKWLG